MGSLNDQMTARLRERLAAYPQLQLPPPCILDMQAEVIALADPDHLTIRFPVLPRYQNPLGYMQGGFIAAALDNTMGPFSCPVAPPSVTTQMTLNYLRPVTPGLPYITCTARLRERSGKVAIYEGVALNPDGKVLVLAQATTQQL
jgi:uncharacterized protein (TIGR00369 family)